MSAKVTDDGGRFEQTIAIYPDSEYELVAYVRGAGNAGVVVGDDTSNFKSFGDGENWVKVTLPFPSGANEEAAIFGGYVDQDGRFDAFDLVAIKGPALQAALTGADDLTAEGPKDYATLPS